MISTQFWSFKSSCYLPNIACVVKRERAAGGGGGGGGGGGWGGRKEKKEGRKQGEGIGERRKGTPAIITPFCSPLRTLATENSDCMVNSDNRTSLLSTLNWRFQLACVVLSNIFWPRGK